MKVSVVIPVYNTGEDLSRCVDSVLAQTLDDFEVIFVDDGSDDGTERRLDELAAEHHRVRVIHLRPSGGPGGPRNAGIDAARGDYVYFLDDDDWLGEQALARMHAMAARNDSDIVIGKMVGHGRRVPRLMFRADRDRADVLEDHLLGILTPHKMFRRAFLNEHKIRFPEGPVRLEDHRFVIKTYFRARTISVLGSYPCCHWMKRPGSYSRNLPEPVHYMAMIGKVLDIIDEHVEPGTVRDRYYVHWYRGKILKRFGDEGFLSAPEDYRRLYYEEARRLAAERFGPGVDQRLRVRMRVRSELLRTDAYDALFRLMEAERGTALEAVLDGVTWRHRLDVRFTGRLIGGDGMPLAFPDGRWEPPVALGVRADARTIDDRPWRLDVYMRRRSDKVDLPLPIVSAEQLADGAIRVRAVAEANELSSLTDGTWDLYGRIDGGGWTYESRLSGYAGDLPARGRLAPYRTVNGNLSIKVTGPWSALRRAVQRIPGARRAVRGLRA